MAFALTIESGFAASSAVALTRAGLVALSISSQAAAAIVLQAAALNETTATSAHFWTLGRSDGGGGLHIVHSGTGNAWGAAVLAVTPWVRVAILGGTAVTSPRSYVLVHVAT